MIRVIISSKELAETLNSIDLENNAIISITSTKVYIELQATNNNYRIYLANIIEFHNTKMTQVFRRWDWIRDLLNQADEQPIVLTVTEKKTSVLFEF